MAIKTRDRSKKFTDTDAEAFINAGGTLDREQPSPAQAAPASPPEPKTTVPAAPKASPRQKPAQRKSESWQDRARSDKKTEATPFRFNKSQQALLRHAKETEGRDYSKILETLVWPALEEKYGKDVPLPSDG